MDPTATATIMRDTTLPADERHEAATNLLAWLDKGGYPQSMVDCNGRHISFGGNTAARFAARQEAEHYATKLAGR